MNAKHLLCSLAAAAFGPLLAHAAFSTAVLPTHSHAQPGDIAVGTVVTETADHLDLNVQPCASQPAIVTFHMPYAKQSATATTCNGASVAQVQVIQK